MSEMNPAQSCAGGPVTEFWEILFELRGGVVDAVTAADHRPIVVEWAKGKTEARGEVVLVRQVLGFTIQVAKEQIGPDLLKECLGIGVLLWIKQSTLRRCPVSDRKLESIRRALWGSR